MYIFQPAAQIVISGTSTKFEISVTFRAKVRALDWTFGPVYFQKQGVW